jgi:hypothetical protein
MISGTKRNGRKHASSGRLRAGAATIANREDVMGRFHEMASEEELRQLHGGFAPSEQFTVDPLAAPSGMSPRLVIEKVAAYFHLPAWRIVGRKRTKQLACARNVAMYLVRRRFAGLSLADIAREFDHRDHTTVLYSLRAVERQMRVEETFRKQVNDLDADMARITRGKQ